MLVRPYEMPWRPAYELWAAGAWAAGLCYFVYLGGKEIGRLTGAPSATPAWVWNQVSADFSHSASRIRRFSWLIRWLRVSSE